MSSGVYKPLMALIDELRALADLPESHIPALNEIQQLVGKLAAYIEHGSQLFKAADQGAQEVSDLLAQPTEPAKSDAAPAETATAAAAPEDKDAEIAALRQQVQTLLANQQRTQAGPAESAAPSAPAPAAPSSSSSASTPETW